MTCRLMLDKKHVSWSRLSNELWGQIFAHLKKLLLRHYYSISSTQTAGESKLYATRLVCRQFNNVFQECPDLYSSLTLIHSQHHPPCATAVPSLELWIGQHHAAVRHIRASCNDDYVDAALRALATHGSGLAEVRLETASNLTISRLGAFKAIASCTLQGFRGQILSLQVLKTLPNLTQLNLLHGHFSEVDAAEHLTGLSINHCQAVCGSDCRCTATLVNLHLREARLERFHDKGLAACERLCKLACLESDVTAVDGRENMLFAASFFMPSKSLSAVTSLTSLSVSGCLIRSQVLSWLTDLGTLQHLYIGTKASDPDYQYDLDSDIAEQVYLPKSFSVLTALTSLEIDSVAVMHLHFRWDGFELLQRIGLQGRLDFDDELLAIAESKSLKEMSIGTIKPKYAISSDVMTHLVYKLALRGVKVTFTSAW